MQNSELITIEHEVEVLASDRVEISETLGELRRKLNEQKQAMNLAAQDHKSRVKITQGEIEGLLDILEKGSMVVDVPCVPEYDYESGVVLFVANEDIKGVMAGEVISKREITEQERQMNLLEG